MKNVIFTLFLASSGLLLGDFGQNAENTASSLKTLKSLSLDEKIGQLFVIPTASKLTPEVEAVSPYKLDQEYTEFLIKNYHVGGLIFLFPGQAQKQVTLTNHYQKLSKLPLWVFLDAEWGPNMRLKDIPNFPRNMALGAIQNDDLVYQMAYRSAQQLSTLGVHMNLAPVADINSNPANPVIHDRSFGDEAEKVAAKAVIFMRGLLDGGVLACGKHFPGHGDTAVDSHEELPTVAHDKKTLCSRELQSFAALINAGVPALMTAHIAVPALDDALTPASLSPKIIKFLKEDLNFKGLIITDGLGMKAVTKDKQPGEPECTALLAGNDNLLCPVDVPAAVERIKQALRDGTFSEQELDEHVLKILHTKELCGLDNNRYVPEENLLTRVNTPETQKLKKDLYAAAITALNFRAENLADAKIGYIQIGKKEHTKYQEELLKDTRVTVVHDAEQTDDVEKTMQKLKECSAVNIGIFNIVKTAQYNGLGELQAGSHNIPAHIIELISALHKAGKKVVITLFGSVYSARLFKDESVIIAYEEDVDAQEAAAQVLIGKREAVGVLPVNLNSIQKTCR